MHMVVTIAKPVQGVTPCENEIMLPADLHE
jgi:hypothetical protein